MINTVTIVGNLTAKPELRYTPAGQPVANFTVAYTQRVFDKTIGQWGDGDTLFLRCNVWGETAEHVARELDKGFRVIVTGHLKQSKYTDKDGSARVSVELDVDEVGQSLRFGTKTPEESPKTQVEW